MLNNRQEILLRLSCACIQSGKYTLKDVATAVTNEGYLEDIVNAIEDELYSYDEVEEEIINQKKQITNSFY